MSKSSKVGFISLGCPKALVDSERILTQLKSDGYDIVPTYDDADVVVVNTCGFIDSAKQESLDAIAEAMQENGKVIVTGCMGTDNQGDAQQIRNLFPNVLDISGPQAYEQVVGAVHQWAPAPAEHNPHLDLVPAAGLKLTPRHYAYLKISEGCNHSCSFCIIPDLRGKLVSREAGDVLEEARRLADAGVKELLVISQDTSAYGVDLKYRTSFWNGQPVKTRLLELCEALAQFGIWVRLHYVYPYPHVDEIIPLMAEGKILPYLDIPFQHASLPVLKAMKRPAATENTLQRIHRWREICPDLAIRSTFIVGFPGETDEDFEQLLEFLTEAQLERVGCFTYSAVKGARANELADPVDEAVKQQRYQRLMEHQQQISAAKLHARVGNTLDVLVDHVDGEIAIGRSRYDAPEIDGIVQIEQAWQHDLKPGDIAKVTIMGSDDYDLFGEIAD